MIVNSSERRAVLLGAADMINAFIKQKEASTHNSAMTHTHAGNVVLTRHLDR